MQRSIISENNLHGTIAKYSAVQSVAEIGIGSIVHSFHIPFAGHLLSINQGLILTLSIRDLRSRKIAVSQAAGISVVASLLKSLSFAGKRLTPMLAIGVQGLLYSLGLCFLGANLAGAILGITFLSLWGFLQPLLIAYLLYGFTFFEAVKKIWTEIAYSIGLSPEVGVWIILSGITLKILLAWTITAFAWFKHFSFEQTYVEQIKKIRVPIYNTQRISHTAITGSLLDLLNPWFLIGAMGSILFFIFSAERAFGQTFLYSLRVIGIGWLFFWIMRAGTHFNNTKWFEKFPLISKSFSQARERITNFK